ncbi:MAG: D-alanyl-D-alanine carboxypeptidase [Oscillospiraceae bacterium]|nr:D-alanyl-D-alanine carboxypeptidase [Oscillospiraceae bacterium]
MKRIFALLLIFLLLLPALPTAAAEGEPEVAAEAAVLMEKETGTVLFEQNAHARLEPASVTKVMTILLITEAIESGVLSRSDTVTVSAHAAEMGGSQVYLEEGEQMTVDDLLKATVVSSANDAAVALAEQLAGSESAFVARMNQRAAELGMNDTTFVNCTGLPAEEHLTSAWDIALMSRALIAHDFIKQYTTIWMDSIRDGAFGLANTNKLIRFYDGATGLKTGSTDTALYCLSATAEREGMELIAVVLKAPTSSDRFETAKSLLDFGFANYTLLNVEGELSPIPVTLGTADTVTPVPAEPPRVLVEKLQADGVTWETETAEALEAPVEAGARVGRVRILLDGAVLQTVPLVVPEGVPRLTFGQIFGRVAGLTLTGTAQAPS